MNESDDELVTVLPVHFSTVHTPNVHIHQYPLLTRPLQVPPSAQASGKRIRARVKPSVRRFEVHVPVDTRPEVWNNDKAKELGVARAEDDREKNQESQKLKLKEGETPRLSEVRLRSEQIPQKGCYMLGVVRDGHLQLHPISETHQMRPTLTYIDLLTRKTKRSRFGADGDSDSDDGPPPDPDEEPPAPVPKKEKKPVGEAKEIQVAARRGDGPQALSGGLSAVRREMLVAIRAEEDERWEDLEYCDGDDVESGVAFEALFSQNQEPLKCETGLANFLRDIPGL
ncbi:hypothetical protein JAAARDRAFT_119631 [Jaapia argillacea MUCL 33604]|uniref:DNA-directed RNA polymerase III subunit Rpc5 n=1 Tax=Jaapia argillacea MUCL 33604 TaxID=933084 RepID=A0A067Q9W3_9AGAM|nr:hypothetical protein JAAARDRAFT_119631 [Jaapia argillacea MUCL 33604]